MAKITTIDELREEIRNLEHQNYVNEQHMRRKVSEIADRLKPMNIVKNLFGHLFGGTTDLKGNLFKMAAGLATSFVVKKFFKKGIAKT
ncbi:MAG: hypothetical protein JST68_03045 [Bacteroidetes bacterium]|nr:hypothetical protein [Bacteroidota bacterium]